LLAAVPEPDIDAPLDFRRVEAERLSDPQGWPEPYRLSNDDGANMIQIAPGHFVRVRIDQL
ncbi:MAG: hypothetical protein Q8L63_02935, partial [Alphaproteobacteria bacterium]|nr:hypothetical protein [Alphaproteobacteria bacterium]